MPRQVHTVEQAVEQGIDGGRVERTERQPYGVGNLLGPTRRDLRQLRPRRAHDEQRNVRRQRRDVLEQIEQGRLGPMDVIDHYDKRTAGQRGRLEEAAYGPGDL